MADEKFSPEKIFWPVFSSNELCTIAEIDRKLANLWLERGVIKPTHTEPLAVRSRPHFSCVDIFKARLTRELSAPLDVATSSSRVAGIAAEVADGHAAYDADIQRMVNVAAHPGWMHGSARAAKRKKPFNFWGGLSRTDKCWEFQMDRNVRKLVRYFGAVPLLLFPVGAIFDSIYLKCEDAYNARSGA